MSASGPLPLEQAGFSLYNAAMVGLKIALLIPWVLGGVLWGVGWMQGWRLSRTTLHAAGTLLLGGVSAFGFSVWLFFLGVDVVLRLILSFMSWLPFPGVLLIGGWMVLRSPYASWLQRLWDGMVGMLLVWAAVGALFLPAMGFPPEAGARPAAVPHDRDTRLLSANVRIWGLRWRARTWVAVAVPWDALPRILDDVSPTPLVAASCEQPEGKLLWVGVFHRRPDTLRWTGTREGRQEQAILPLPREDRRDMPVYPLFRPVPGSSDVYIVTDASPVGVEGLEAVGPDRYRWVGRAPTACARGQTLGQVRLPFRVFSPPFLLDVLPNGVLTP